MSAKTPLIPIRTRTAPPRAANQGGLSGDLTYNIDSQIAALTGGDELD